MVLDKAVQAAKIVNAISVLEDELKELRSVHSLAGHINYSKDSGYSFFWDNDDRHLDYIRNGIKQEIELLKIKLAAL